MSLTPISFRPKQEERAGRSLPFPDSSLMTNLCFDDQKSWASISGAVQLSAFQSSIVGQVDMDWPFRD